MEIYRKNKTNLEKIYVTKKEEYPDKMIIYQNKFTTSSNGQQNEQYKITITPSDDIGIKYADNSNKKIIEENLTDNTTHTYYEKYDGSYKYITHLHFKPNSSKPYKKSIQKFKVKKFINNINRDVLRRRNIKPFGKAKNKEKVTTLSMMDVFIEKPKKITDDTPEPQFKEQEKVEAYVPRIKRDRPETQTKKEDIYVPKRRNQNIQEKNTNNTVRISNLPSDVDRDILRSLFSPFGNIRYVKIINDYNTNLPKYAYVCYRSSEDAMKSIHNLNKKPLGHSIIEVEIAKKK